MAATWQPCPAQAAYYQPSAAGEDADSYWLYHTQSNTVPTVATANATGDVSNPGANVANYLSGADWNALNGNVTTVGSAAAKNYFGTADQGGNVWEAFPASLRGGRNVLAAARSAIAEQVERLQAATEIHGAFKAPLQP